MDSDPKGADVAEARRQFLAKCGRFAVATPPAVSLLLAASRSNYAVAASGTGGGTPGGNGGISTSSVNTDPPPSPTNGVAAGSTSCRSVSDALFNSSKCF